MENKEFKDNMQSKHPNFIGDNGKLYLVRCFKCNTENYAMAVATGICAWCGWSEKNKEALDESDIISKIEEPAE